MKLPLVFHPEIEDDLIESQLYYSDKTPGLAKDFVREVRKAQKAIAANPKMHQIIWKTVRRSLVNRFPFGLFYRIHKDRIEVLAVYHHSRDPAGWQSRV